MIREWYYQVMGQELGPLSGAELKSKAATGQIQPDTLVRKGPEGKWTFGGNVKGLFAVPEEPPPPPDPKPTVPASPPPAAAPKPSANSPSPPVYIPLAEEVSETQPPSVEFYNFVGFREAISPVLHDVVKQFASERGLSISQLNRRALAAFVQRPELASDLLVTAIAALPQPVCEKLNFDGSSRISDRDKVEVTTFRVTLFNSCHDTIHVKEGAFLPESLDERIYDTIAPGHPSPIDHTGHIRVAIGEVISGKPIRLKLNISVPPQAARDIIVWFYDESPLDARKEIKIAKIRGQLIIGHGRDLAMSEFFTISLHSDGPHPDSWAV